MEKVVVAKSEWSVDELTRLAFIHAESDRRNMAECDKGEYGQEAGRLADAMLAYRVRRWGKTSFEAEIENATLIDVRTGLPVSAREQQ